MSVENIYDFETPIEAAFAALLVAAGVDTKTPADDPTLQSARPRVELLFQVGGAKQSYHLVNGVKRNATWQGQLTLDVITDPGARPSHRAFRAQVRNAMANWQTVSLTCHKIQNVVESSTTPEYKPQDGYEVSKLIYTIDFGVDAAAWVKLTT